MSGRDEKRGLRCVGLVLLLELLLASRPAHGQPAGRLVPRLSGGSNVEWALARASRMAGEKLRGETCREVFSDFRDGEGRPLSASLQALGFDGADYLDRRVLFYQGRGSTPCDDRERIAFTSPGSAVVFVCSSQFVERAHRDPGLAADLLIHEELHSLGLGENPPSSQEITARVIARCGK